MMWEENIALQQNYIPGCPNVLNCSLFSGSGYPFFLIYLAQEMANRFLQRKKTNTVVSRIVIRTICNHFTFFFVTFGIENGCLWAWIFSASTHSLWKGNEDCVPWEIIHMGRMCIMPMRREKNYSFLTEKSMSFWDTLLDRYWAILVEQDETLPGWYYVGSGNTKILAVHLNIYPRRGIEGNKGIILWCHEQPSTALVIM